MRVYIYVHSFSIWMVKGIHRIENSIWVCCSVCGSYEKRCPPCVDKGIIKGSSKSPRATKTSAEGKLTPHKQAYLWPLLKKLQNPRHKQIQTSPLLIPPTARTLPKVTHCKYTLLTGHTHTQKTHLLPVCCPPSDHSDSSCWRFVHFSPEAEKDKEKNCNKNIILLH